MFGSQKSLTVCILILGLSLLAAGCWLSPGRDAIQVGEGDFIAYAFGGGEAGAEWTEITIRGDGRVTYHYRFPFAGTGPRSEITREHSLSPTETQEFFQALLDAGLFDLRDVRSGGADIPGTSITASVGGRELDVTVEWTPDERIHGRVQALLDTIWAEWITRVAIHVNPVDGYATCEFRSDGWAEGGHESGGFVHTEQGEIPAEGIAAIWEAASVLNPSLYPVGTSALRDCVACIDLFIYYDDGRVMHISWPFGEEHPDYTVQTLVELIYEYNIGGW